VESGCPEQAVKVRSAQATNIVAPAIRIRGPVLYSILL
jgi:hypothetical protein